jgi:SPP1 gp7 family putative phage head morphogenesis protein
MTKAIPNISQYFFLVNVIDPTKTITLRQRFVRDMNSRFFRLMADVKEAIVDLDAFGLKKEAVKVNASGLSTGAFDFPTNSRKIDAFTEWMDSKAREYILAQGTSGMRLSGQIGTGMTDIEAARKVWINTYLDSAYQQGIRRARQELRKKGVEIDEGQMGGDPIKVAFNGPIHADRIGMIYTRAYTSLKGITAEMESAVSDVLAMGLAEGRGPKQIARILDRTITGRGEDLGIVDKLGRRIDSKRRAEVLARTETIRAHHAANIGEYRAAGAMGISVLAEHLTAGDGRVCPKCAPLNGKKYTLEEAEYIIPVHPQCRCVAIPYIEDTPEIKEEKKDSIEKDKDVSYEVRADALLKKLTKEEKKAIKDYTGSEYLVINGELRENSGKLGYIENTFARKTIRNLDSVLDKSPLLDSNLTVYRGVEEFDDVFPDGVIVGDSIIDYGFVSTSINKKIAEKFVGPGGYLFEIKLKPGTKAGFILKESNASEVLLPRYNAGSDKHKLRIIKINEANKTITAEFENE